MRARIVVGLIGLVAARAHAMGAWTTADLRAWNSDGCAALVEQDFTWNGERGTTWTLVAAFSQPVMASLSDVSRTGVEQLSVAECTDEARRLGAAVEAHHFAGVEVHPERCAKARASVVVVSAAAARDVAQSWIEAPPQGRALTAREQESVAAVKDRDGTWKPLASASDSCVDGADDEREAFDVADRTGKLILVFSSRVCATPVKVDVQGFVPSKGGYVDGNVFGH
jgi:hypothetical protein